MTDKAMNAQERAFWDRAVCAALGGLLACPITVGDFEEFARLSAQNADAALTERRKRRGEDT